MIDKLNWFTDYMLRNAFMDENDDIFGRPAGDQPISPFPPNDEIMESHDIQAKLVG